MTILTLNLADFFASIQQRLGEIKTDIAADGFVGDAPTPGVGDGDDATITIDFDSVLKNGTGGDDNGVLALQGDGHFNILNAMGGNDVLIGKGGLDILLGGAGIDTADYSYLNGNGQGVFADLAAQLAVGGVNDVDILHSLENLIGSQHDDVLLGNSGNNVFQGNGGNDFIDGRTNGDLDGNGVPVGDVDVVQFYGAAEEYTVAVLNVGGNPVGYTFTRNLGEPNQEVTKVIGIELVQFKDPSSGDITLFALNEGGEGSLIAIDDTFYVDEDAGHVTTTVAGDDETPAAVLDVLGNDQELGEVTATHPVLGLVDSSGFLVNILAGTYGTLTYEPADGTVTYTTNAAADALQVGDTPAPEVFKYRVAGGDEATITIDVQGTNDAPVVTVAQTAPAQIQELVDTHANEGALEHSTGGSFYVADVDSTFVEGASLVTEVGIPLATFTPSNSGQVVLPPPTLSEFILEVVPVGSGSSAEVNYTFKVQDSAIQFLGEGDTLQLDYTVRVSDGEPVPHTKFVDTTVSIVISGKNDEVVISSAVAGLEATESGDASAQEVLITTGVIEVQDLDVNDVLTATFSGGTAQYKPFGGTADDVPGPYAIQILALLNAGNLTQNGAELSNGGASGIEFTYSAPAVDLDFLAAGDELILIFTATVSDNSGSTPNPTTPITITITGTNDAPTVAAALSEAADEGAASFTVDLLGGASDVDDGATLGIQNLSVLPAGVTVVGTTLTVDPADAAFEHLALGVDEVITVTYDVVDAQAGSVPQTLTITITGTNDAPTVAAALSEAADEGAASFTVDLLGGASDVDDGATLGIQNLSVLPAGVTVVGTTLTVDPADAAFEHLALGVDEVITVTYDVVDAQAGSVPQTLTITITGTNDAPTVAAALSEAADEGAASFTVDLLGGASDVDDGATLGIQNLSVLPAGVTVVGTTLTVDPADAAFEHLALGVDEVITVTYDVVDAQAGSVPQTLTITITGTNDAPTVAAALSEAADEGAASFTVDLLGGASDVDDGATLGIQNLSVLPAGVTVVGTTLTVDPADAAFEHLALGVDEVITVTYDVVDAQAGSVPQTLTITITGTNDAPTVAAALSEAADEGAASFTVDLLGGASDVDDGATLGIQNLSVLPAGVTVVGTTLTVDPADAAFEHLALGVDEVITVTYDVVDAQAGSVPQTLTITITGTNDAPTVAAALSEAADEGAASFTVDLLGGASDVDDGATLGIQNLSVLPAGVTVVGTTLTVDPADAAFEHLALGVDEVITVTYDVVDAQAGSVPQTLTITITGTNDAPTVAAALSEAADEGAASFTVDLLGGASDVDDGATLGIQNLSVLPAGVTVVGTTLTVDPADAAFEHLALGVDEVITVTYDVVDAQAGSVPQTLTITITGTNDAPTVAAALSEAADEGAASFTVDLLGGASDVDDGATLGIQNLSVLPAGVTVVGTTLTVDPADAAFEHLALGVDEVITVTYDVVDAQAGSVPQTLTITITGTNDAPTVAAALSEAADEGAASFTVDLLGGASDVDDGATLGIQNLSVLPAGVTVVGTTLTVDPADAAFEHLALGVDEVITITYDVVDAQAGSVPQTLTITITGTNDGITITSENLSGSVHESLGTPAAGEATLSDTGDIEFDDVDVSNIHILTDPTPDAATVQSFDANGDETTTTGMAPVGALTAMLDQATNTVTWTFQVDAAAVEHLADGETIVQTYVLEIDDQNGDMVQKTVEITINGTNNDPVITAETPEFVLGFDNAADSIPATLLNYGTVTLVGSSDSGYIPTAEGGGHARVSENENATGPFTQFDGYRSAWAGPWTAQAKVYLDTGWDTGKGFDYSVAANGSDGLHQRDFVFHVARDADTGELLINASNNSGNGLPRTDLDTDLNPDAFAEASGIVGASGWYTLQHDFYDDNGVLAVKLSLIGEDGNEVWSTTLSAPEDTMDQVGGNRYGWFTLIDVGENGLAVDGLSLNVADGETLVAEFADGDPMEGSAGNGVHAANGEIPFTDIDLNDAHSVSVTSETTGFVGIFTPQVLAGDEATGGNQGKITWSFTVADSEIEYLGVGEVRSQTYTIQVDDSEGGTDTVDVTVTITGANDGPTITAGQSVALTEDTDATTGTPAMLADEGTLDFTDLDLTDTHQVSSAQVSAIRSDGEELPTGLSDLLAAAFNAALGDLATGDGAGTIDWTFSLADSAVDFLGFGETLTIVYDVTVTDDAGTLDTKQVTVTIHGTNDAPEINEGTSIRTGTVSEEGDLDDVTEAGPDGPFDANRDLDAFIEPLIVTGMDMATALDQVEAELGPNASPADAIAQVWDYLDEHYAYYENVVNEAFARLGVEYAKYLQSGGRPLTDVMAKYAGDVDLDGTPDRQQSLHDNLLGNLDSLSLIDKLATNVPEVYDDIVQLLTDNGLSDLSNDRPIYNGNEDVPNLAQAWDQSHGLLPLASGQMVFSDVDGTAQASVDTTTAQLLYNGAAVSTTNPLPTGLSAAAIAAAFVIGTDGAWAYNANQAHLNALAEGDTLELTYSVVVSDGDLQDTTPVTITITGTNDAPTIENFSGDAFTEVELAGLVGTGGVGGINLLDQFRGDAKDVDVGDSVSIVADGSDEYGVPDGLDADLAVHLETMFGDIDFNLPIEELIEAGLMELGTDGTFSIRQEFADALELLLNTGDSVSVTGLLTVVDTHGATATAEIDLVLNGSDGLPEDLADNYGTGGDDVAPAFLEAAVPVFDETDGA